MSNIPEAIQSFEGKRNAVMTFIIQPNVDFKKCNLEHIRRSITSIKHSNKRSQSLKVIDRVFEETKDIKQFDQNGRIICCGLSTKDEVEYYILNPSSKISTFEYYYDYVFNIQRMREIFNSDVVIKITPEEEESKIKNILMHIEAGSDFLAIGSTEIDEAIRIGALKDLYYTSNEDIPEDLIIRVRNSNSRIIKADMSRDSNQKLGKDYDKMIGILHYAYSFSMDDMK